jgi:diguanylate cyclase (GGDEF)-like protein/PAS domain S-box-containing protein
MQAKEGVSVTQGQEQGFLLVIDDNETNRDLLCRRLQRRGFTTMAAEGSEQAIEFVYKHPFDVVLLDIMMPDVDGLTILQRLRETHTAAELPIIIVAAKSQGENVIEAIELGANDYVTKPLEFPVVLARIRNQVARKRAEETLRESEERFALAMQGANDGLWDWNLVTNEMYYSSRWKAMLGYAEDDITHTPREWFDRIVPEDQERVHTAISSHLAGHTDHFECEYRMVHRDTSRRWVLSRGLAVFNRDGEATRIAGSLTDITVRKVADPITGLPNRVLFLDRLGRAIGRNKRRPDGLFAVLLLDLDRFKTINDSLGYAAGDRLLVGVARRLEDSLRAEDLVVRYGESQSLARLGGDEFAILLEDLKRASDATRVAKRLQETMQQSFGIDGHEIYATVSIGIALSSTGYECPDDMVRDAEIAMRRAKAHGKDCHEIFDSQMHARAMLRLRVETDLHQALEKQEFTLHYQPIVRLETGRVHGFEALIRWQKPDQGFVPPAQFIPIAEETGLIIPIGGWVLNEACRQMRQWQEQFPDYRPLWISVNLSGKEFLQPNLVKRIDQVLQDTGLPAECLKLEITESVIMDNASEATTMLEQLRALGAQISIDDFGTGYCSLSYLHTFPLDVLKVDQSFVSRMSDAPTNAEIVRTIVVLAHNLGLEVVAEGVETAEDAERLTALGCEYAQGYYYSRPLTVEQATEILIRLVLPANATPDA